jgi:hypothetical protein
MSVTCTITITKQSITTPGFKYLNYVNASPRYVVNPSTGAVTGPYAGGAPAIVTIGTERYLQIEHAAENNQKYSNAFA